MIDGISPEVLNGVGVVGVIVLMLLLVISGRLVTKREADVYLKRAENAETNLAKALEQNAELMEMARLGQATFSALHKVANDG